MSALVKIPRNYQYAAEASVYDYFRSGKTGNPVIALPTGTGKALVIAMLVKGILEAWPSQRMLVLTHVKELVAQNYAELKEEWPAAPAGIYSAGLNRKETFFPITFAGIASIVKCVHLFGHIDLVFVDEAHLVNPSAETMYKKVFDELRTRNPKLKVIGLTATPYRLGHGKITEDGIFTDVCFDMTGMKAFNWLLQEGYLAPLVPKPTRALLDMDGVGMVGGEFNQGQLQLAVDKHEVTEAALRETMERAHGRRHWLIFASGVEHAHHVSDMLNAMGVSCLCVHSNTKEFPMSDTQRDDNIKAFKEGRVTAVVNNNVLTTGFNFPAIDLIVMLRPTASTVLWVQMLGRGTRPWHSKVDCLVLDFARNTARLGPINDPVIPRKKGGGGGEAPVKLCPTCETYVHATLKLCPHCGHEFTFSHKLDQHAGTTELIKIDVPIEEYFPVDHMTFSIHRKDGAPEMMKVAYYSGLAKSFYDYVCVEHTGFAQAKARRWWRERCDLPMPATTREAMQMTNHLKPVTHLKVWVNKKYPEIMAYCFDGTAFGTVLDDGKAVSVDVHSERPTSATVNPSNLMDDDIPF